MGDEGYFREFEHTGDVGIEVEARSRVELFRLAAMGLACLMVGDNGIRLSETRTVTVTADNDCDLMHDLLAALLNLFLVDGFIWREAAVEECDRSLVVRVIGEPYDPARHEFRGELKAVTYHGLEVTPGDRWRARVIFDR